MSVSRQTLNCRRWQRHRSDQAIFFSLREEFYGLGQGI